MASPGRPSLKELNLVSQVLLAEFELENTHKVRQAMRLPESSGDLKVTSSVETMRHSDVEKRKKLLIAEADPERSLHMGHN